MCNELLLICGDFSIHMDVPSDADTIRLNDLLNSMGLVQHVKRPTHIHGHTLLSHGRLTILWTVSPFLREISLTMLP